MGDSRKLLSRQDLLSGRPSTYREVDAGALGGVVLVRGLTGAERQRIVARIAELEQGEEGDEAMLELSALIAGFGMVDAEGNQLFGADHYRELLGVDAQAIDAISKAVLEESGLSEKEMEALRGKSEATPSSGSSSGSHSPSGAPSGSS